jgi:hypothetical protein
MDDDADADADADADDDAVVPPRRRVAAADSHTDNESGECPSYVTGGADWSQMISSVPHVDAAHHALRCPPRLPPRAPGRLQSRRRVQPRARRRGRAPPALVTLFLLPAARLSRVVSPFLILCHNVPDYREQSRRPSALCSRRKGTSRRLVVRGPAHDGMFVIALFSYPYDIICDNITAAVRERKQGWGQYPATILAIFRHHPC